MKSILCVLLMILLMPSAYAAELPGDSADGKRLHDANCMGCHDTSIYTRKDRLIQSLDALKERLGDCSHMAKKEFSANETQNIIKYLNDQFYHFRHHRMSAFRGKEDAFSGGPVCPLMTQSGHWQHGDSAASGPVQRPA